RADATVLAEKVQGAPRPDAADHAGFIAEVEALRVELAGADEFRPGYAVAAAHAAIRARIPFLQRDRALAGEVAAAVQLVVDGEVLAAARLACGCRADGSGNRQRFDPRRRPHAIAAVRLGPVQGFVGALQRVVD